ncbi:MAG: L,D-transpeptidase [Methylotetracoccus sp.]
MIGQSGLFDRLRVSLKQQQLDGFVGERCLCSYPVSTARNGPGERQGSGCTPRGWHRIRAKIGAHAPAGTVFVGRRPTGEIYDAELAARWPERDWILTRILWLGGMQPGFNRYRDVDTTWRYIYIHGSPDHGVLNGPQSHGCVRMRSADLIDLFDRVAIGTRVLIEEHD